MGLLLSVAAEPTVGGGVVSVEATWLPRCTAWGMRVAAMSVVSQCCEVER